MDLQIFGDAVINGVPLFALVLGLVQFIKGFGVSGNGAKVASLIVGLLLGVGYMLTVAVPVDFAGWFGVVVYGLALGLTASGVYDTLNKPK